jgi:4-amino-4-deoxy-L-arabinose transferase-like glycosyltransferase
MKDSTRLIQALIILIGSLLFIPFLGHVNLFDWDEINFAEAAREMIVSKNYLTVQINYLPFWEKPPLFIWMQVLSMKVFGVNEFAARFPNAICGITTLLVLFRIGRLLRDNYFGVLWVLVYTCSVLPFFYFKSGIIDPWFNLFIFLGVYCTFKYTLINKESWKRLFITLSGIFIGLGVLTKGPVALLIYLLTFGVFYTVKMFKLKIKFKHILLFVITLSLVGGFWFILQMISGNFAIIKDFVVYQVRLFSTKDAGHGGFFLYHFVVLFLGVFPASLFALLSFRREKKEDRENVHEFKNWMMTLFWTVLILFTIVKTKIVHYSSLCYFPLTFLGAYGIYKLREQKQLMPRWLKILILIISFIWGLVIIGIQVFVLNKERIIASGYIKDQFAVGNLQANVSWSGYEFLIGLIFITAITLVYSTRRLKQEVQIISTLVLTLLFTYSTLLFITPRIEGYSQHAAIEFYKTRQTEDCYVTTLGFKSYAHMYYFNLKPFVNSQGRDEQWLLTGAIDKPAYFVIKNHDGEEYLSKYPELKVVYEENGFIFAKRETKP